MSEYLIKVVFESSVAIEQLAALLQDVYDKNGVAGFFNFERISDSERSVVFERYSDEDGEYILEAIPIGDEINDASLSVAAGKQLLAELTEFDTPKELAPMIQALRDGKFVMDGVETLRRELGSATEITRA